jgi:hypothetical protein
MFRRTFGFLGRRTVLLSCAGKSSTLYKSRETERSPKNQFAEVQMQGWGRAGRGQERTLIKSTDFPFLSEMVVKPWTSVTKSLRLFSLYRVVVG